jgi:CubicO group peptidase (beta-lactamase class C family)
MPPNFDFQNIVRSFAEYSAEDLYACLSQLSLDWDIGRSYVYSNLGYGLLGHIAETATGESWHELVTKHICEPLEMNSTRVGVFEQLQNVATPHQGERPVPALTFGVLGAAGALRSSAKDIAIFLSHNLGLRDSGLSAAMKKAHQMHYQESAIFGLGLGWHIQQRNGLKIVWHRGETHGQTSFMAFDLEAETGVLMLSNSAFSGCCSDIAMAQIDSSLNVAEQEPHDVLNVSTAQLERFTGEFALDPAISFLISAKENYLRIGVTGQPGGKVYPVGQHQFETQDRRVIVRFSDDLKMITIKQHGVDRIAKKSTRSL